MPNKPTEQDAHSEAPPLVKSDEQPVMPGSGQTFVGVLRARLPMPQKATYIDWSPDGKWLLVDGPELWSTETGKPARKFDPAVYASFHPDGKHVIGSAGKTILLWDMASGAIVKKIPTEFEVDRIVCSADGSRLLLRKEFESFGICDVQQSTSRKLNSTSLGIDCSCGAISPDGKTLAMSREDGKLALVDADTLAVKATRDAHQGTIDQITFSHDGKLLATCCDEEQDQSNKVIRIWNATTGDKLNEYLCDDKFSQQLKFSRGDTRLLSSGRFLYVDAPLGKGAAQAILERRAALVKDAVFSPDAHHVAAITNTDQDIHLFDLYQTREARTINLSEGLLYLSERLVPLSNGDRFLALRDEKQAAIFDAATMSKPVEFGEEVDRMPAISPDGKTFVAPNGGSLYWYDLADAKELRKTEGSYSAACFHPDGKHVLAGKRNFDTDTMKLSIEVQEIDATTGDLKRVFSGLSGDVTSVTASKDGRWLAAGGKDGHVHLFDYQSSKLQHQAQTHEGAVSLVRFSPSGEWLVSLGGESERKVSLWKTAEAAPKSLAAASSRLTGAVFDPESKQLVISNLDGQFCIWDLTAEPSSFTIPSGSQSIRSLDPLPTGDGFIGVCPKEQCAKIWQFRDLRRPAASDTLVRTDVTTAQ